MNALQLSIELSFDQLAAIVKKLSPGDREKLMIKMWQDDKPEKLTKQQKEFIDKRIKAAKDNPERMIPLDTFVKRLRQK